MSCAAVKGTVPIVHSSAKPDATVNPCTLCAPLGATLATVGVRGAVPLLHGAQGCATYIRRYLISHFREPMDVASSSFGEAQTVFGGEDNLGRALDNVLAQYHPELVTVATTCLAETIGDDVPLLLTRYRNRTSSALPLVHAATPSYKDGHVEGFHAMVYALVKALACNKGVPARAVNLLPPLVSPADLRHLREIVAGFDVAATVLPDYADRLDGVILGAWGAGELCSPRTIAGGFGEAERSERGRVAGGGPKGKANPPRVPISNQYRALPDGGTRLVDIAAMPRALASIDLTLTGRAPRASKLLADRGAPARVLGLPIGVRATDAMIEALSDLTNAGRPAWLLGERGRLLDAYADGHKYVFGARVGLYGDPEFVAALAGFLLEIGARPVFCATGARNRALPEAIAALPAGSVDEVLDDTDFESIGAACERHKPDLLMGSSKGYRLAHSFGIPLLRVGFPIHDRLGAGRILHVGYRGTTRLFDELVNALLQRKQDASPVGFSYL
jgi:nitrogenase molybdenum-iron protein NifN